MKIEYMTSPNFLKFMGEDIHYYLKFLIGFKNQIHVNSWKSDLDRYKSKKNR